jgi:hypothetical protein
MRFSLHEYPQTAQLFSVELVDSMCEDDAHDARLLQQGDKQIVAS